METLWQDLRFSARMLAKSPGFTAVAVIALALGIGANTAIFSVVNAVLVRPLAYSDSDRLVALFTDEQRVGEPRNPTSPANFLDWKDQSTLLEHMTAAHPWSPSLTGGDRPEKLSGLKATPSLFQLLGISPALGQGFPSEEGESAGDRTVVLGHGLWQRRFGADPGIVGQTLTLDGNGYTVVGVMPPGFQFPPFWATDAELWVPLVFTPEEQTRRRASYLRVFARLKPGATHEGARAEMDAIARRLRQEHPDSNGSLGVTVDPLREPVVRDVRPALLVLFGTVGFVLLIGCANVAGLLLARVTARQREVAVRMALGASRGRLLRQFLTESLLLGLIGGAAGLLLAKWGVDALVLFGPGNIPRLGEVGLDGRVLAFTLLVSVLTSVIFGFVPALRASRPDLNECLKEGGRHGAGPGWRRLHGLVVVSEIALASVLLIGAGLTIKSFLRLQQQDPGLRTENVLTMSVSLAGSRHAAPDRQNAFFQELAERVVALPGVERAGLINLLPIGGDTWRTRVAVEGAPSAGDGDDARASFRVATADAFRALDIPLVRGRWFGEEDGADAPGVVLVNQTLARRLWPGEDPVGKRIKAGGLDSDAPWSTVVGVVGDVRQESLASEVGAEIFYPYTQNPNAWFTTTTLVARTGGDPLRLAAAVQAAVWEVDRDVPVSDVRTMEQILSDSVRRERFSTLLLGIFAGVALVLATVGIYGVISYSVSQRTREIGVRMALGAHRRDILRLVVGQGLGLTLAGIGAGVLGAFALTRFLSSMLFGVSATDAATFAGVALMLATVAVLACYVPARRAARVDPMVALRHE